MSRKLSEDLLDITFLPMEVLGFNEADNLRCLAACAISSPAPGEIAVRRIGKARAVAPPEAGQRSLVWATAPVGRNRVVGRGLAFANSILATYLETHYPSGIIYQINHTYDLSSP